MQAVYSLCSVLAGLLSVYSTLIWIRLILSWVRNPEIRNGNLYRILSSVTDPYLNIFRGRSFNSGRVDWSPLVALMCLNIVRSLLQMIAENAKFTIWLVVAVVVQNLWFYIFRYFFIILLVMLIARACIDAFGSPASKLWLDGLDRTLNSPVSVVFRLFYSNGNPSDRKLVISSIIFYGAIYFGLKYGVQALVAFLVSL